ncbi:Hypothetical predicted protein [Marmota monax]|uniref:Uncharacterized protein n=1 Tax=Marmota monax TaxID=9995 RepID=A0A5E4A5J2_MARMO|nr:Hypothetical predicted protein [Marmota monax]
MVAGAVARGPALPVAHQRPALRRALLGRRRAPAAAAGRPGRLAPDAARGHPGRDLPRQLQLRVAAPAGARAARPRAARGPDQGMSILQEKDDVLLDLKQKFWNTYKWGLAVLLQLVSDSWAQVILLLAGTTAVHHCT